MAMVDKAPTTTSSVTQDEANLNTKSTSCSEVPVAADSSLDAGNVLDKMLEQAFLDRNLERDFVMEEGALRDSPANLSLKTGTGEKGVPAWLARTWLPTTEVSAPAPKTTAGSEKGDNVPPGIGSVSPGVNPQRQRPLRRLFRRLRALLALGLIGLVAALVVVILFFRPSHQQVKSSDVLGRFLNDTTLPSG